MNWRPWGPRWIDLVGVKGAERAGGRTLDAAAPRYTLAWVNQLAGAVPVLLISLARAERVLRLFWPLAVENPRHALGLLRALCLAERGLVILALEYQS